MTHTLTRVSPSAPPADALSKSVTMPRMSLLLAGGSKAKKGDPGVPQDHNSVISALEKPGKQRTKLEKRKMAQVSERTNGARCLDTPLPFVDTAPPLSSHTCVAHACTPPGHQPL